MAETRMRHLVWRLWWADRAVFLRPGLYVWACGDNRRILPVPKREGSDRG